VKQKITGQGHGGAKILTSWKPGSREKKRGRPWVEDILFKGMPY
jgi:hypothetical protein